MGPVAQNPLYSSFKLMNPLHNARSIDVMYEGSERVTNRVFQCVSAGTVIVLQLAGVHRVNCASVHISPGNSTLLMTVTVT